MDTVTSTPLRVGRPLVAFRSLLTGLYRVSVLVALLAGWEIVGRLVPTPFVPPLSEVMVRFVELWFSGPVERLLLSDLLIEHITASGTRIALGWGGAAVVGIIVGVVIGLSAKLRAMTAPVLRFSMCVPASALLPIAIGFFGVTDGMNAFLIAFASIWTILVNTADGVGAFDEQSKRTARSLRLPARIYLFHIVLPAASPYIFAGLRTSIGIMLAVMVIGELYAASKGVGFFIALSDRQFRYLDMWAGVVLVAILGLLVNLIFSLIERRVLRWHFGQHALHQ